MRALTMHDDVAVQREGVVFFGRAVSVEPEASDRCELMILVRGGLVFRVYRLHGNTASVDGSYLIYPYFWPPLVWYRRGRPYFV